MARKTRRKPRGRRTAFWVLILLALGVFAVIWWFWPGLYSVSPRLDSILFQKNDQPMRLLNGETLHLHPSDRVSILSLSTNITFNVGIRLFARGFDVTALCYGKQTMADLLSSESLSGEQRYRVHVLHHNTDIGHIDVLVGPFVEDWLEKANRIIEPAKRLETLQEALHFAPQDKTIRARLLEEYLSLQKWAEAAELLEAMIKEKADAKLLFRLVEVYEAMAHTDGALSAFSRLMEIRPDDRKTRLRYAVALEKAKRDTEAIREYEHVLRQADQGERLALYRSLGYLYAGTGDIPKAVLNYQKALELDKEDPNLYYNLSNLLQREGDENRAYHYLAEALRLKPEDAQGRLRLSERLIRDGKLDEARGYLNQILSSIPQSMEALLLLVQIAEREKDRGTLSELYGRILALDPENETALYNLAVMEYENGNYSKSLPLLQRYVQTHPEDRDVHNLLFNIYRKEKNEEQAFQEAQNLVALDPEAIDPYHYLFEHLNNRADQEAIIRTMTSALQIHPGNMDFRKYLVLAYLKTGKDSLAMEQMRQMLNRNPNDTSLLLQMAKLQEKRGKIAEALETYRKILVLAPGHEDAGEAYLRLRLKGLPLEDSR